MLIDIETDKPFVLNRSQRLFLDRAFRLDANGRLLYPELVFLSDAEESGKTTLAAMILIYVVLVHGGGHTEGYCVANDLEQAQGRVFQAACRIVEASPLLSREADDHRR